MGSKVHVVLDGGWTLFSRFFDMDYFSNLAILDLNNPQNTQYIKRKFRIKSRLQFPKNLTISLVASNPNYKYYVYNFNLDNIRGEGSRELAVEPVDMEAIYQ
jgi:hypothetical protein